VPADIDNETDTPPYILFGDAPLQIRAATDRKTRQTTDGFLGTARVNRCQCAAMSCIHRVEQSSRLGTAHLADDDAVRAMPKHGLEQELMRRAERRSPYVDRSWACR